MHRTINSVVVLAGGQSRRMGAEKSLLLLDGRPLIGHVIARLAGQAQSLAINANGDAARWRPWRLPVLPDSIEGFRGPLAGILTAMVWAARDKSQTHVATVSVDTPFIPPDLVARLASALTSDETISIATSHENIHYACGLWPVALAADLARSLQNGGDASIAGWLRGRDVRRVRFDGDPDPFFNVNRPEDLAVAEAILRRKPLDSSL